MNQNLRVEASTVPGDPVHPRGPLVIVSGMPGSGKTTLGRPLSVALGVPYIGKDAIKEILGESLGAPDIESSIKLGRASIRVMFAMAREVPTGVLDSHWHPEFNHELLDLRRPLFEIFCACPVDTAIDRIRARTATTRHSVHHDAARLELLLEGGKTIQQPSPLALGLVLRVDTSQPVDVSQVAAWVRQQPEWAKYERT